VSTDMPMARKLTARGCTGMSSTMAVRQMPSSLMTSTDVTYVRGHDGLHHSFMGPLLQPRLHEFLLTMRRFLRQARLESSITAFAVACWRQKQRRDKPPYDIPEPFFEIAPAKRHNLDEWRYEQSSKSYIRQRAS
jgi:hypothetical protein